MSGKKRRKISVQPQGGLNSDINITPMVDVVLVLLIIFMVVTPLLEKDIEVKVPDSEKVEQLDEVPQDQLVVTVAQSGELKINLDVMPTQQEYVAKLSRMLAAKKKGDKLVFFTADDQTNYAKLVAALDGARQAGAETLGMATDKIEAAAPAPLEPPPPPTP
ncbi:MAG: biopolymer transporter ExbD [Archangium sp.]|nr:biopolymer transporter ExbD [Archangium sp.]MDP3157136.1 biopolymer transporter ExbD [Archangium sp.]MDP3575853.1 biopolymer transporter ExbD [Archangium sp.]